MMEALRRVRRCFALALLTLALLAMPAQAQMVQPELALLDRRMTAVHVGPSDSMVIGLLEDGEPLRILGRSGGYYRVDCCGMRGYVADAQVEQRDGGEYYVNCDPESAETYSFDCCAPQELEELQTGLIKLAMKQLGTQYVPGGARPGEFDCSGLVYYVYARQGFVLGRQSWRQLGSVAIEREELQPGDLVFFQGTTDGSGLVSHVGIYAGDGKMIHAANGGVMLSGLDEAYWSEHYLCSRRVLLPGLVQADADAYRQTEQEFWWEDPAESAGSLFAERPRRGFPAGRIAVCCMHSL